MVFRRRDNGSGSQELALIGAPGGVLVVGRPGAVESVVARLVEVGGAGVRATSSATAADLGAIATTAGALVATHGQYVRLTARSMDLLKQHHLVPTDTGSFWGFVRDSRRIKGALDFERVDLGPQQLLSLQMAAVSLALRAAIKEVEAAVERVEGKVDDILGLLRAQRVGDILGTRRALEPLVERVRREGRISSTDWSAVATLGPDIARDTETLRMHIRSRLEAADGGWRPGERARDAEGLFEKDGLLIESIALLIVAEHNLGTWHELRLAQVRISEPAELSWTVEDAHATIVSQNEDDQAITDALRAVADQLTRPQAFDGLAPWQRRELTDARLKLDELVSWFADQRMLDFAPLDEAPYPTAKESFMSVVHTVGDVADRSLDTVRGRVRRRHDHDRREIRAPGEQASPDEM